VTGPSFYGDDGVHRDAGPQAAYTVAAAVKGEGMIARVPGDHGFEVEQHGLTPGNPPKWLAGDIQAEYQGCHCLLALFGV
jgi:hypothetical protein